MHCQHKMSQFYDFLFFHDHSCIKVVAYWNFYVDENQWDICKTNYAMKQCKIFLVLHSGINKMSYFEIAHAYSQVSIKRASLFNSIQYC